MGSRRGPVQVVQDCLTEVAKCLANHRLRSAGKLLDSIKPEVQRLRCIWNVGDIGDRYDRLVDRLRVESAKPCDCWYCGFTAEQKHMVEELTKQKAADFECIEQSDHKNNLTGAYAEVVFGVKFHLPINREQGPDGGIDFRFPCKHVPSGKFTMDIKGTTHEQFRLPEGFNRETDHIYVLIQVVDRVHAFFRGFAFGSDEFEYHPKQFWEDQPGYGPKVLRKLEELLVLVPDQARCECT